MTARVYEVNWVYTREGEIELGSEIGTMEAAKTRISVSDYVTETNASQYAEVRIWQDGSKSSLQGRAHIDGNSNLVLHLVAQEEATEELHRLVMSEWWDGLSQVWIIVGQALAGDPEGTGGFGGHGPGG